MTDPTPALRHDLLTERLLTVTVEGEREALSLPGLLARMGAGREVEFPALRPHQQHAWHAFLVQLAALVLHRRGTDPQAGGLDSSPDGWREGLLDLAGDAGGAAWHLVAEDLSLAAFLQPPVPEGSLAPYKKEIPTPDELDVVATTRNHDVKQERMTGATPEHWIYALVTLQTMEGFLGRGNYGIARMNGGFSNRPYLSMAPGPSWTSRFARDVRLWLEARPDLTGEDYTFPEEGGLALLWLDPWDGRKESKKPLAACDPFFIEICRRIRLVGEGKLQARMAATKDYRLDGAVSHGDTGDLWTPVGVDGKALTVGGRGFDYRSLTRILFSGDFRLPPSLEIQPEDGGEPSLLAQTLVRGQGQTEGYHRRTVPIPKPVRGLMASRRERDRLGKRAQQQVEAAATTQRKILNIALCALLQKGDDQLDFRDERARRWLDAFDRDVDRFFFATLWAGADLPEAEARALWEKRLLALARKHFDDARRTAPVPVAHRLKAEARAELMFRGLIRKHLPLAFDPEADPKGDESGHHAA